jgi:hypothetical protein
MEPETQRPHRRDDKGLERRHRAEEFARSMTSETELPQLVRDLVMPQEPKTVSLVERVRRWLK